MFGICVLLHKLTHASASERGSARRWICRVHYGENCNNVDLMIELDARGSDGKTHHSAQEEYWISFAPMRSSAIAHVPTLWQQALAPWALAHLNYMAQSWYFIKGDQSMSHYSNQWIHPRCLPLPSLLHLIVAKMPEDWLRWLQKPWLVVCTVTLWQGLLWWTAPATGILDQRIKSQNW
jgi:hypothetical protein